MQTRSNRVTGGEGYFEIHPDRKFISVNEAIIITGLSRSTLYELRRGGKIKWSKIGKTVKIVKKSLLEFMGDKSNSF